MAITLPTSELGLNGKYRTAWRVTFVALSLLLASILTAIVFLFIPAVNDSVKLALDEGGVVFVLAVIVPSGILAAITTAWGIVVLWRATDGGGDRDR